MISWGSMDYRGSMDSVGNNWGSVDSVGNWVDSVVDWGMDSMGNWGMDSVSKNWGMDGMVDWGMDGMNSMGDSSISGLGSESLALGGGSVLSLVWLADRLMADLTVSISIDRSVGSIVHWGNGSRDWGGENWGMDSGMVSNSVVHQTKIGTGGGQDSAQTQESLHVYLYV